MRYSVAITTHKRNGDGTENVSMVMDTVSAANKEEALGKFIINRNFDGTMMGAYRVMLIVDTP